MALPGLDETFWALKDVSFDVRKGEVIGIIGRNGAGQEHAAQVAHADHPAHRRHRRNTRPSRFPCSEVGTGFHPELTGRENVFLNGAILGMRNAEVRGKFDDIVEFAELQQFIDTPVKHYSSGMYTRLAFAVAAPP